MRVNISSKNSNAQQGFQEEELIRMAVKSLGLDELAPFDPKKKIIEYLLEDTSMNKLIKMDLREFANETASESPAPGGGSVAAYMGALGISLATLVANLCPPTKTGLGKPLERVF